MLLTMKETFEETYARVVATPEPEGWEIPEPGVIRAMRKPGTPHRFVHRSLVFVLSAFDRGRNVDAGWWVDLEPEVRFGPRMYVPDIACWRLTTMPAMPAKNPVEVCPDLVIEIRSPGTGRIDLVEKLPRYLRAGVGHVWIVEPVDRVIEVFTLSGDLPLRVGAFGAEDSVVVPPFDAPIAVSALWAPPEAPPAPPEAPPVP